MVTGENMPIFNNI